MTEPSSGCCTRLGQAWTRYKKVLSEVGEKIDGTHSVARRVGYFILGLLVTAIAAFALSAYAYGWLDYNTDWRVFSLCSTVFPLVVGYVALLVLGIQIMACAIRYSAVKDLPAPSVDGSQSQL